MKKLDFLFDVRHNRYTFWPRPGLPFFAPDLAPGKPQAPSPGALLLQSFTAAVAEVGTVCVLNVVFQNQFFLLEF